MRAESGAEHTAQRMANVGLGCLVMFLLPFCLVGVVTASGAVREVVRGNLGEAAFLGLFALLFGGVGFGAIVAAVRGRGRASQRHSRELAHPEEPWRWRPEWESGRIEGGGRGRMHGTWAFAVLWNLVSIPAGVAGIREGVVGDEPIALVAGLFPLVGVVLLVTAIRATIRYRKFGVSVLELVETPVPVGRALRGTIRTGGALEAADVDVRLVCVRRRVTGSGKNRSTSETIEWEEERTVRASRGGADGSESAVAIVFPVPADAQATDQANLNDQVIWRVEAKAEVPGVDFETTFDVPVFRTAASGAPLSAEEVVAADDHDEREPSWQPVDSRIQVSEAMRGTEIVFPPARNLGASMVVTTFTVVWVGFIWLMVTLEAPVLFPIVFGVFGLLLTWFTVSSWLGFSRVEVSSDRIDVTRGLLWIGNLTSIPTEDVEDVQLKIGMTVGSDAYYDLQVVRRNGRPVTVGSSIRAKREAEWLRDRMRDAARLS